MARFIRRGKAKVYFLPTIAAPTLIPTGPEITAGTDLTDRIADLTGWNVETTAVATPDLGSRFVSNIPGERSAGSASITFYADDAGTVDDVKTTLAEEVSGFVYIAHSGRGTGKLADTFPIRVSSVSNEYSMGNDPARFMVSFSVTDEPAIDKAQPAVA